MEKFDLYGGRGTKLGNNYSIHTGEYTLDESLNLFAYEISKKLVLDKEFRAYVFSLEGKKIACSCKKTKSDSPEFAFDTTRCHIEFYCNYINSSQGID